MENYRSITQERGSSHDLQQLSFDTIDKIEKGVVNRVLPVHGWFISQKNCYKKPSYESIAWNSEKTIKWKLQPEKLVQKFVLPTKAHFIIPWTNEIYVRNGILFYWF